MEVKVYNQQGKEVRSTTLADTVFGQKWNGDLVHQVVTSMMSNARTPIAHTKDRGDVSGTGKKPWRQKGTGRARHGSRRSPIWRTGGITFGPRNERSFDKKINKKMRAKALYVLLSEKLRNNEILFVDALTMDAIKTAEAKKILENLSTVTGFEMMKDKKRNAASIYLPEVTETVERSFANFGNVAVIDTKQMNPLDLSKYKYLVMVGPEDTNEFLASKLNK